MNLEMCWEKFMRITSNSEYDILGTVQPDHEDLIRNFILQNFLGEAPKPPA